MKQVFVYTGMIVASFFGMQAAIAQTSVKPILTVTDDNAVQIACKIKSDCTG
jgi:hypothetical protein